MSGKMKRFDFIPVDGECCPETNRQEREDGEYVLHSDYAAVEAECERLRAEVAELRKDKDKARIDWIEKQSRSCTVYMNGESAFSVGPKLRGLVGRSYREALDNAMARDGVK